MARRLTGLDELAAMLAVSLDDRRAIQPR